MPFIILSIVCTIFIALIGSELVGYIYHRLAHAPGTALYRAHMRHHLEAYPAKDFYSNEKYRDIGTSAFTYWFVPLYVVFVLLQLFLLPTGLFIVAWMTTTFSSIMNLWVHNAVHVLSMSMKFVWFKKARILHLIHHANMTKNFGIWFFLWDGVFGTKKLPKMKL